MNTFTKPLIFISLILILVSCNDVNNTKTNDSKSDSILKTERLKDLSGQIERNPENAELLYQRAQIYFNDKYLNKAEADMETAIQTDSMNPIYHFNLARIQYAMNKTILAAQHYEKAIALKPDYQDAKLKLADLYFVVKEHQKSVQLLNNALTADKSNSYIYHMLGMNFKETGDTARAIYHFQTAVENDPADYESTLYIANLYAAQGRKIAFEYYNAALKLRTKGTDALFARAVFAQKCKMYKQALMDYRRVIDIEPGNYLAYYNVGYINFENKMFDEALRNWDICIRMNPNYGNAFYMKGLTCEILNNNTEALINYKKAIELEPENNLFNEGLMRIK
ncbi:MAG: tetratricopeptide repeat protein [Bacteroidota bacterium]|nr:tetratricopeptide repeat protein [Bacteroidota bacterium]